MDEIDLLCLSDNIPSTSTCTGTAMKEMLDKLKLKIKSKEKELSNHNEAGTIE